MTDQQDATDEPIDVLNLYAGIGGNRKLWEDVNVTAVEWDEDKADIYRDHFPDDDVIVADAHEYLLEHYDEYDFIWASPPCPSHSPFRKIMHQDDNPKYPDMKLWQEIILLKETYGGDYVVENVIPYYDPLIDGKQRARHMFWSNFHIPEITLEADGVKRQHSTWEDIQERYGYDLSGYDKGRRWKRKVLNNCVHPKLGKHVFDAAVGGVQQTLSEVTTT